MSNIEHKWSSYETSLIHHHIINDDKLCEQWKERTKAILAQGNSSSKAKTLLSIELRDEFETENPLAGDETIYAELMNSVLYDIDWDDLAEVFIAKFS